MKRRLIAALIAVTALVSSSALALNPHILEVFLDIDGVADPAEFGTTAEPGGPGGFVAKDGWKKIILGYSGPAPLRTRLNWNSTKIAIYTDTNATVAIPNEKVWDIENGETMPSTLWVKGLDVSSYGPTATTCGPEHICLEAINNGTPYVPNLFDRVGLTVYMVESITVTPKGTPVGYELPDPVKIAAGAIASDAHQADVVIQVLPNAAGIPIDVSLLDGRGHETGKDAKLVMGPVTAIGGGATVTSETSTGGEIDGVLTSSDVLESCTIHTSTKECQVLFTWDEFDAEEEYEDTNGDGEYTTGEPYTDADGNGEWTDQDWTSDPPFLVIPGTSFETLRLRHHRGICNDENWKPLNGHNIRFYVEEVRYMDTDGTVVTLLNTPDSPSDLSAWASFANAPITTDSNGKVTAKLTMENKPNMILLRMAAYDFSVWDEPATVASSALMTPLGSGLIAPLTEPAPPAPPTETDSSRAEHQKAMEFEEEAGPLIEVNELWVAKPKITDYPQTDPSNPVPDGQFWVWKQAGVFHVDRNEPNGQGITDKKCFNPKIYICSIKWNVLIDNHDNQGFKPHNILKSQGANNDPAAPYAFHVDEDNIYKIKFPDREKSYDVHATPFGQSFPAIVEGKVLHSEPATGVTNWEVIDDHKICLQITCLMETLIKDVATIEAIENRVKNFEANLVMTKTFTVLYKHPEYNTIEKREVSKKKTWNLTIKMVNGTATGKEKAAPEPK